LVEREPERDPDLNENGLAEDGVEPAAILIVQVTA
jgi:hypothetical protein